MKKTPTINTTNLAFYFDGLQRDRQDHGSINRRVMAWLAIREQLVRMPDEVYETTMAAIESLVQVGTSQGLPGASANREGAKDANKRAAQRLYESAKQQPKAPKPTAAN